MKRKPGEGAKLSHDPEARALRLPRIPAVICGRYRACPLIRKDPRSHHPAAAKA